MAVLKVARLGNPVLRQIAQPLDLKVLSASDEEIQRLIDDMVETMREMDGVGLAAPQVFHSAQLVVMECSFNERYPDAPVIPLTVLVNPVITKYGDEEVLGWEGCLSLNDLRGQVPRSNEITVEYFDRKGDKMTMEAEGFQAVVLQHEIDHLHGKVFLDRMTDLTQLTYLEEFETYFANQEAVEA
ncbi:formylmethionine deformylase [Candidatus Nitromaritima sp. SCGC AAA799-A02]|nr:formylmethionine deformylase [Candidatus Nitromaritima sp. SCGC AAA799-A02]